MDKLKEVRKAKGLTQSELAALVGCSTIMISKIETRQNNPSLELLKEIARVLETKIDDLI